MEGPPGLEESWGRKEEESQQETVDEPDPSLNTEVLNSQTDVVAEPASGEDIYKSALAFEDLGISKQLLDGLYTVMHFQRPSRIQAKTLPMVMTPPYQPLVAQAHSGCGKTTCFALAMLSRVDVGLLEIQALCICPTRELVVQNRDVISKMGKYTGIRVESTADEEPPRGRIQSQIVVGTHGRLKNWYMRQFMKCDSMKILVFDEADEMLQRDGFADDSVRVIKAIKQESPEVQILLFSATYNEVVKDFALRIVPDANRVFVPQDEISLDVIKQYRVQCPNLAGKISVLIDIILPLCDKLGSTIVFVRSREMAKRLHSDLEAAGYKVTSIQGEMDPQSRDRVVKEFRNGITKFLVATDILARGFDVSQVTLVVNFDLPILRDNSGTPAYETYLHRIGRSGRFGRPGIAFNLLGSGYRDATVMDQIEQYFSHTIDEVPFGDEDKFTEVLVKANLKEAEN